MTPPSVAEANANAAPDLGVLFVHGIGNQIAGQTLVQFGDPLLQWLDEWHSSKLPDRVVKLRDNLAKTLGKEALTPEDIRKLLAEPDDLPDAPPATPSVTEARIKTEGGIPAHAHVKIPVTSDNNGQPKRWILAESCWRMHLCRLRSRIWLYGA
jgi:hypothetical protein